MTKIKADILKDKKSGLSSNISDLLYNKNGKITNHSDDHITVSNSENLNGKGINELRSNVNATTIAGYTLNDITQKFKIKLLAETTDMSGLAVAERFMVAATYDNKILFWGRNTGSYFIPGAPEVLYGVYEIKARVTAINIKKIVCAGYNIFVLYEDGFLFGMGQNSSGFLGQGHSTPVYNLLEISQNVKEFSIASTGSNISNLHLVVIKTNNTVYSCGRNLAGQLGLGYANSTNVTTLTKASIPAGVGNPIKVYCINGEYGWTFLLTDAGKVLGTGYNANYQLGLNDTINRSSFTELYFNGGFINSLVVSGGGASYNGGTTYARDNTAWKNWYWGLNDYGEVGNTSTSSVYKPTYNPNIANVPDLLLSAGKARVKIDWFSTYVSGTGNNTNGQIFRAPTGGNYTSSYTTNYGPVVKNIYISKTNNENSYYSCYMVFDDVTRSELFVWGYANQGQRGDFGTAVSIGSWWRVFLEFPATEIKQFSNSGYNDSYTTYILTNDGKVYATGNNDYGEVVPETPSGYISQFTRIF